MPGSEMCLRLKQNMKTNNERIQSATSETSLSSRGSRQASAAKAHSTNRV